MSVFSTLYRGKLPWELPPACPEEEAALDPPTLGHGSTFPPLRDAEIEALSRGLAAIDKRLEGFWPSAPVPARPGDDLDALLNEREAIGARLGHFGVSVREVEKRLDEESAPRFLPTLSAPELEETQPLFTARQEERT